MKYLSTNWIYVKEHVCLSIKQMIELAIVHSKISKESKLSTKKLTTNKQSVCMCMQQGMAVKEGCPNSEKRTANSKGQGLSQQQGRGQQQQ